MDEFIKPITAKNYLKSHSSPPSINQIHDSNEFRRVVDRVSRAYCLIMNKLFQNTTIGAAIHIAIFTVLLIGTATTSRAEKSNQEKELNKVHTLQILLGDNTMIATLKNTAASRDFIAQLPMTLELRDYASTEKVADLPQKLSTHGAPDGYEPSAGDITYYAPWGNLAIFYRDFGYSRGLVNLGRIIEGTEQLNFRGAMSATFEIVVDE